MTTDEIIRAVQRRHGLAVDGDAGPKTWGAVFRQEFGAEAEVPGSIGEIIRVIQASHDLVVDGEAGPLTWAAIHRAEFGATPPSQSDVAATPPSQSVPATPRREPPPLASERSESVIATLLAPVQEKARALVALAEEHGIHLEVLSGLRTYEEQQAIFDRHDGSTRAPAGHSNHNFGLAFDVGVFVGGKYADDEADAGRYDRRQLERQYASLGPLGKALGLTWGGDWASIDDEPHFELHPPWADGMSESEMLANLRARHDSGTPVFA